MTLAEVGSLGGVGVICTICFALFRVANGRLRQLENGKVNQDTCDANVTGLRGLIKSLDTKLDILIRRQGGSNGEDVHNQ